ncbi:hypothetical protein NDU88_004564 [Pleurodeles waltl]|uniref:Uncharacterized protein n=1 Tax=Pleurodeles waltl TaxID=8319 RepID=A0AAV7UII6_PLEWA|nr:hypothetical protein NDU88_004564 [Pleurodeles waltl]
MLHQGRVLTEPASEAFPDYPLLLHWVLRLKLALEEEEGSVVTQLILEHGKNVNRTIELANDDWMKDPAAQLHPLVLLGHRLRAMQWAMSPSMILPSSSQPLYSKMYIHLMGQEFVARPLHL